MFGTAKYTADGTFDKLKSRIVAGGHLQDIYIYLIIAHRLIIVLIAYSLSLLFLLRKIVRSLQSTFLAHS
jgi:hypothetical protein